MKQERGQAGTHWRNAGFLSMRAMILLPLLVLAACGDKPGEQPGIATNIVDEAMNQVQQVPQGATGLQTAAPAPEMPSSPAPGGAPIPARAQRRWGGRDDSCAHRAPERDVKIAHTRLVPLEHET